MKVANSFIDSKGGPSVAALAKSAAAADLANRFGSVAANWTTVRTLRDYEQMAGSGSIAAQLEAFKRDSMAGSTLASIATREAENLKTLAAQVAGITEQERARKILGSVNGMDSAAAYLASDIARCTPKSALAAMGGSLKTSKEMFDAIGGVTQTRKAFDDVAAKWRREVEALPMPAPPSREILSIHPASLRALRAGPTFAEALERNDQREERRHREQIAFAKEENDLRSADNDRREARNDQRERLIFRVAVIFGIAGILAAVWGSLVSNFFGG